MLTIATPPNPWLSAITLRSSAEKPPMKLCVTLTSKMPEAPLPNPTVPLASVPMKHESTMTESTPWIRMPAAGKLLIARPEISDHRALRVSPLVPAGSRRPRPESTTAGFGP